MLRRSLFLLAVCLIVSPLLAGDVNAPIPGVGKIAKVLRPHTDFEFTEGPAADSKGNVYFSDIPKEKIYKVDLEGKLSVFIEKSNHANGLMFNGKDELVACEMDGQIVAYDIATKKKRSVVETYNGKRFNAPNDLVVDKAGGVYFTDPSFRAPKPMPQDKLGVYYVGSGGKINRIIDNLPNPNGVRLSIDEKTLYVIPTGQAEMMAYPVESPGNIGKGTVFCTLKQSDDPKMAKGGDGLTIDVKGNLYITSALGLQVFDPSGKMLGIIRFPEQPSNATFGGADFKTLYVTARKSLYTVQMEVKGHRFPGK